jgi:lipopolysaccharide export system protein LptA
MRLIAQMLLAALLTAPSQSKEPLGDGPLEFRCDNGDTAPDPAGRSFRCSGNVVVRRGSLMVCCNAFEGILAEGSGWERFTCSEDVRAQRGDETMWSDRAEFIVATSDLILTGQPRLHRGKSILRGERVVIDVKSDRARVIKPRGRLESINADVLHSRALPIDGPLPEKCPLPSPPR